MDLKLGLLIWLPSAMLLGHPQMSGVEGLECDICYHRFGTKTECKRMPCNSWEDLEKAGIVFEDKYRNLTGQPQDVFEVQSYDADAKAEEKNDTEWMCLKGVGTKPTKKGAVMNYDTLRSECWYSGRYLNEKLPARNESYDGSMFELLSGPLTGYEVTVCDESNEDKCRVTEEELARPAGTEPPPRGLKCTSCFRVGQFGSKSCVLMPCDSDDELVPPGRPPAEQMMLEMGNVRMEWNAAMTKESGTKDGQNAPRRLDHGADADGRRLEHRTNYQSGACVKVLGKMYTDKIERTPFSLYSCQGMDPDFPPRITPYKNLTKELNFWLIKGFHIPHTQVDVDELYVCDLSNLESCRESRDPDNPEHSTVQNQPEQESTSGSRKPGSKKPRSKKSGSSGSRSSSKLAPVFISPTFWLMLVSVPTFLWSFNLLNA